MSQKIGFLPDIKVPHVGSFTCTVGNFALSIQDFINVVNEFDEKYRGPFLACCVRLEQTIDELVNILFLYLVGHGQSYSKSILKKDLTLNQKIINLLKLSYDFDLFFFQNIENATNGKVEMGTLLKDFKSFRNFMAHGRIEPRANNKRKTVDIFLVWKKDAIKIDKVYLKSAIKKLHVVNNFFMGFRKNFKVDRK